LGERVSTEKGGGSQPGKFENLRETRGLAPGMTKKTRGRKRLLARKKTRERIVRTTQRGAFGTTANREKRREAGTGKGTPGCISGRKGVCRTGHIP